MRFDEKAAECLVFTFKEGLLSPLGHDLKLHVTRFVVEVADDRIAVEARFDAASLRVQAAMVDGREAQVSARDRRSIESTIVEEILRARRFPEIVFRSTAVTPNELRGALTLVGRTRDVVCKHEVEGGRHVATARLHQPDFGIAPYSAMLGTLRIRPDVLVRVSLPVA
jgi:polyisoprenoid-binding protein YceI